MAMHFIEEATFTDKKVLLRLDLNVPLSADGKISDSTRIDESLATINYILQQKPKKLILMSHFGRPKGKKEAKYSLEPVAQYLAEKLKEEVILTESCLDEGINTLLRLSQNQILLLENLRFHPEEEANDKDFAKTLASYGDIYVNDAFGALHRKHASVYNLVGHFKNKTFAGFLIKNEMEALKKITENPTKPFVAIVGGVKVSDKIKTLEKLLPQVSKLLIGGAMAYPFLKAKDINVGDSLCSDEDVSLAKKLLQQDKAHKITLPIDHIVANKDQQKPHTSAGAEISNGLCGFDIGPKTLQLFQKELQTAQTVFWNGPMGLFENPAFSEGSLSLAKILSHSSAYTFVGGGDSVSAVKKSGLAQKISHVSTGGGAALEYVEKGELPGINALRFGVDLT